MQGPTWIKICGVTLPEDIELVHAAGADAVGLNFIARSKRRIDSRVGQRLATLARGKLERVGIVEDLDEASIRELIDFVGLDAVQLHGDESDDLVQRLGALAYKAVGIGSAADVRRAQAVPGHRVLVDARVGASVGGTGTRFDWSLVRDLCRSRPIIVAGGLDPDNVADAIVELRPHGIDVASGVEVDACPGRKDENLVRRFVAEIRRAEEL